MTKQLWKMLNLPVIDRHEVISSNHSKIIIIIMGTQWIYYLNINCI